MALRHVRGYGPPLTFPCVQSQAFISLVNDSLRLLVQCLRTGKKCVYIQSRRGRRRKSLTADASHSFSPRMGAPASAVTCGNASMRLELDADLCPDLLVDDDDAVFDSLFFNPSYPFTTSLDFLLDGEDLRSPGVLRQYRCDHDMLVVKYVTLSPTTSSMLTNLLAQSRRILHMDPPDLSGTARPSVQSCRSPT